MIMTLIYFCFSISQTTYFFLQFHYKQEGSYSIGTVGMCDEDCDFIDCTYVSLTIVNKITNIMCAVIVYLFYENHMNHCIHIHYNTVTCCRCGLHRMN